MPLYEYQCKACEHRFERIQKFSDPLETICPSCGKDAVKQMLSAPAVQFKGSGWYVTDYSKKNGASAATGSKVESSSESKSETKSESASETKSEPKAETKTEAKPTASA